MTHAITSIVSTPADILAAMREDLELVYHTEADSQALVAGLLRRLCGFMCPCPQHAILAAAKRSLAPLGSAADALLADLERTLDSLLVVGDVIEVTRVGGALDDENRDWLFCGPPAFLALDGRCYVFGIAPDDAPVLAGTLRSRLRHDGVMRYLDDVDDRLGGTLLALGMRRHTASTWLPRAHSESPERFIEHLENRLASSGMGGDMPTTEWLMPATVEYLPYHQRWNSTTSLSGLRIGRAQAEFGAPVWFVAQLADGRIDRALVLPLADMPDRACDQAWRIQLAMDARRGSPGRYKAYREADGMRISFSFPVPLSTRRRLVLLGGLRNDHASAGSIWIHQSAWAQAEQHLQSELWLRNDHDFIEERLP